MGITSSKRDRAERTPSGRLFGSGVSTNSGQSTRKERVERTPSGRKFGSGVSTNSGASSLAGTGKKGSAKSGFEPRVSSLALTRRGTVTSRVSSLFLHRDGDSFSSEDGDQSLEMSPQEAAFLTRDVRERLSQYVNGMLPPAPALFPRPGAALFVDISGFTLLGDRLLQTSDDSKQAAEKLARQITYVLGELTRTCLAAGGDVAKFAGDALLCTFQGGDADECLIRAQNCAVDMLMGMRRYNNSAGTGGSLEIHGGIAKGSILHFHLGSLDDELRWYLVAGDAVASAVALVDHSTPGQILLSPKAGLLINGKAQTSDTATALFRAEGRGFGSLAPTKWPQEGKPVGILDLIEETPVAEFSADYEPITPRGISQRRAHLKSRGASESEHYEMSLISFGNKTTIDIGIEEKLEVFEITADSTKVNMSELPSFAQSERNAIQNKAIYDVMLHSSGTAYIPKALRAALRTGFNASEMRSRVSVVFVGLLDLALSDEELTTHVVSGDKLDRLNNAFVSMTRVSHSFDGEIRDLLFDDKGCIFIAVFGAHGASEMSELKATKCAMAISQEFPKSKVGVSVGTCFVGMCGSSKRHDFVVMGHEVNVAARCMVVAQEGEVLVSHQIEKETRDLISYEKVPLKMNKHNNESDEEVYAYRASSEIARRPSFLALYRYGLRDRDLFIGRAEELKLVEDTVNSVCFGKDTLEENKETGLGFDGKKRAEENVGGSGIIVLEAQAGMGKSAFVSKVKKLGKGRIKIASTAAFQLEQENEYFVFRHLIEAYTGFRRDMTKDQLKRACAEYGGEDETEIDLKVLGEVLPWIKDTLNGGTGGMASMKTSPSFSTLPRPSSTDIKQQTARIGKELMKVFMGFRGELTLNQILAGESSNGALLVIEDVQWMDYPSLLLLQYLLTNVHLLHGVVFFLTTRTDNQVGRGGSFVDFENKVSDRERQRALLIDELLHLAKFGPNHALTIHLHGLAAPDCDRLVARLLDVKDEINGVAPDVREFVFEKTDGFPMYVVLLMEWIKDHNILKLNENEVLDWIDPSIPTTANFPNTLADTMLARFDRLDVQTRNLLKIASTMGNEFDAITLTTLANIDLGKNNAITEEKTLESLMHAQELGVVTVKRSKGIKESAHKWKFKHDTMLLAIQSIIPTERVNRLKALLTPMRQEVEKKKLVPLFAGFLGEVDEDD